MTHPKQAHALARPLGRCGELVGWASAGLVIAGTASFAIAAVMADFL